MEDDARLIAAAKEAPGKITIGNCGSGCNSHIAAALMAKNAGIQLTYVPFDGHAPGRTALLGGHLDVMMLTPGEAIDYVKSGQLRGLAVTADKRFEGLDVPTLKEAAGFEVVGLSWRAIGGPAGMPADVVAKLADAFKKGMETAEFQEFARKGGFPLVYMNTATMTCVHRKGERSLGADAQGHRSLQGAVTSPIVLRPNAIVGLALIALAAVMAWATRSFPGEDGGIVGPDLPSLGVAALLAVLGVADGPPIPQIRGCRRRHGQA